MNHWQRLFPHDCRRKDIVIKVLHCFIVPQCIIINLKSWKPFTGSTLDRRRPQASRHDVQALEMLRKQLGTKVSPHVIPSPCIEELSESPAVCQALEIVQNTEGKTLMMPCD